MITTSLCTIYHYLDNTYTKHSYPCHWQDTQSDTVNKTGLINTGSAAVYIPAAYSLPTLNPTKDLIIKGEIDFDFVGNTDSELSAQLKQLKAKYNVKVIASVDYKNYGSAAAVSHYKIIAKG